ncbi:hypothetical protein Q7A53_17610 [Halobacillus rhizosphaerae]|uniref:hypothetical protein n=1 Tax=Halobacillus rhizosphaerae TaxID=3064889 RepID=UPI00398B6283
MKSYVLVSFLLVLLLAGCYPHQNKIDVISASPSEYDIYLYTPSDEEKSAASYLNALLDWKIKQGNHRSLSFKKTQTDSEAVGLSENDLPALVIKKKGKIVTKISGNSKRPQILSQIEESVSFNH